MISVQPENKFFCACNLRIIRLPNRRNFTLHTVEVTKQSSESQRASSDQKQRSESNKANQEEIDKEYELSSALLFQVNLAHSLGERRTTPALERLLDQGSNKLITEKPIDYSNSFLKQFVQDNKFNLSLS